MTRAEMYQTVREGLDVIAHGRGMDHLKPRDVPKVMQDVALSLLPCLAALEAEEREAELNEQGLDVDSLLKDWRTGGYECTFEDFCKWAKSGRASSATPPAPPAAEAIVTAFARDFFVRHDHTYSGIEIYEWLKKQVTGPVAPPAAECAARSALRQVQWCSSDEWQLCPLCDQCEKNGHSPDCPIGAALTAPCECQRLRAGLEAWKEEFGTDNPELAALESKNFGASEMVRVIADIESPGVIGDPTAQEIRERLRELAAAKSDRNAVEHKNHALANLAIKRRREVDSLAAELRQAVAALRPFADRYIYRTPADLISESYERAASTVTAYDAKYEERRAI